MSEMKKNLFIKAALCMAAVSLLTACQSQKNSETVGTEVQAASKQDNQEESQTGESEESRGVFEAFTAQDLDGNQVDQSIFADADLTMINVWGTFCTPCLDEMPDLGELSEEYKDKGMQIIGICSDTVNADRELDEAQVKKAKELAEQTGADYLHLAMSGDLVDTLLPQVMAVPMTIFVDSEGKQVGSAYMGARDKDGWTEIIEEMLASVQGEA
ncbi:TlpA family protein disulfide reductase [Clostridium sp. AM29-11AC]|nr:TlpA family protein disulfide reductase [Clostridium sp. AM29-11AC]